MKKKERVITIGLFGFTIVGANLGCQALAYSMLILLERIRKKNNLNLKYCLFDSSFDKDKLRQLCEQCKISPERISVCAMSDKRLVKKMLCHVNVYKKILECLCVIDITGGDSYTDIYGMKQLKYYTRFKRFTLLMKKKLILAPQTFGPFNDSNIESYSEIINRSTLAIARDRLSVDFFREYCNDNIYITTDIAFLLPFKKTKRIINAKKSIGISVSALLYPTGTENTFNRNKLNANYKEYIHRLISILSNQEDYEVFLISHVECDHAVAKEISLLFPNCEVVPFFESPIEAKSFISNLDYFIGARMHATLAAFSTGVCTIPVAYSRKFKGLYNNLGYEYIIDLTELSTDSAIKETFEFIGKRQVLCDKAVQSLTVAKCLCFTTEELIKNVLLTINKS